MSTSGLIAAKKRIENAVRRYDVPTDTKPNQVDRCENGALLLSLLQSRLNWTNAVFARYKMDPVQQPKRTTSSRKKWPHMRYLGTCDLEIGAHLFEQTIFYEAVRTETWRSIAEKQGLPVPEKKTAQVIPDAELLPVVLESEEQPHHEPKEEDRQMETNQPEEEKLVYLDIVFELREFPNERFVFPKETIVEAIPLSSTEYNMLASFTIPFDSDPAEAFFLPAKEKILKYGQTSQLDCIKQFLQLEPPETREAKARTLKHECYEPVTIQLTNTNQETVQALQGYVDDMEKVRKRMKEKMKLFPQHTYIQFDLPKEDPQSIEMLDLVRKAAFIPDIATGPVQAEKKRNEILNAIKLGKRERDEKFESELPKYKLTNAREDGSHKCAYCSSRTTVMWRIGPDGHGTLCNSCGIQWRRGEILKDAPAISAEEERKLVIERRERERTAETLELEKSEKEVKKYKKIDRPATIFSPESLGPFAARLLQQRSREGRYMFSPIPHTLFQETPLKDKPKKPKTIAPIAIQQPVEAMPPVPVAPSPTHALQPLLTPCELTPRPEDESPAKQEQDTKPPPLSLYNAAGIPLPTLSIDFMGYAMFSHPNCGITLLDSHFSIRLSRDGSDPATIEIEKNDLQNADFEVVIEGEKPSLRDVLKMKVMPQEAKSIHAFDQMIPVSREHPIQIRFLEKLDPSGGAVVKRILQRWLVTLPQQ
ncbi:hypothetical protein EDC96DRAFT_492717 [Choanephora cucurbitarum]|nr:hypothetical protein EDC96DRAFT_492717 [Choanephora cucurbitarum]